MCIAICMYYITIPQNSNEDTINEWMSNPEVHT